MLFEARHISRSIDRDPREVIKFASDPANLPRWAAGLSSGMRREHGKWLTDSPMGVVEVRFHDGVEFGILDHTVVFPDGTEVVNPLRVLRNGEGSEVVFTIYRLTNVMDEEFERDAQLVREDLERLREVLELAN